MDELQLIAECKNQNRKAQKLLYERFARTMYAICLRYASSEDEAKDLLQDGFIHVFDRIVTFEGRGSFEGWMRRVFVNLALENIRKNKNIYKSSENIDQLPEISDNIPEDSMHNIPSEDLMEMVRNLPDGYSTVFSLYAIDECSHREIAEKLHISEGTSRSQYARARGVLQEKIKEYLSQRD